jgi:hypothetical protein
MWADAAAFSSSAIVPKSSFSSLLIGFGPLQLQLNGERNCSLDEENRSASAPECVERTSFRPTHRAEHWNHLRQRYIVTPF